MGPEAKPKEWPLIFTGHSVRQTLAKKKWMTRRLVGPRMFSVDGGPWPRGWKFDLANAWLDNGPSPAGNEGPYLHAQRVGADTIHRLYPLVQVGDRIIGRETWSVRRDQDGMKPNELSPERDRPWYRADGEEPSGCAGGIGRWRSPLFMPKWASRLVREVMARRVERLQQISEVDARAEGVNVVPFYPDEGFPLCDGYTLGPDDGQSVLYPTARKAFPVGWDELHREHPGSAWKSDPWVLVLTYGKEELAGG